MDRSRSLGRSKKESKSSAFKPVGHVSWRWRQCILPEACGHNEKSTASKPFGHISWKWRQTVQCILPEACGHNEGWGQEEKYKPWLCSPAHAAHIFKTEAEDYIHSSNCCWHSLSVILFMWVVSVTSIRTLFNLVHILRTCLASFFWLQPNYECLQDSFLWVHRCPVESCSRQDYSTRRQRITVRREDDLALRDTTYTNFKKLEEVQGNGKFLSIHTIVNEWLTDYLSVPLTDMTAIDRLSCGTYVRAGQ